MYITPFITARIPSAAYRRRVWREGSAARHTPIRHQSGRSDISSDRGCTSPGSCPSTSEAPPRIKNQEGVHRIQVIRRNQEVSGRTLSVTTIGSLLFHGGGPPAIMAQVGRVRNFLVLRLPYCWPFLFRCRSA